MENLAILGSTGSIGTQTLDVVRMHPRRFRVVALSAGANWRLLAKQIREFQPRIVALSDPKAAYKMAERFPDSDIEIGEEGVLQVATTARASMAVSAITGVAGLAPTLAALEAGRDIALANKESLVLAGELVHAAARKNSAQIYPVDSEHSGLWELLRCGDFDPKEIRRVILTASGGALRDWPLGRLRDATVSDVLQHPNWDMGAKITVDSATLVNKALEIIEAAQLFRLPLDKIDAVIHPQSRVHALVEWVDGSVTAQLAEPDMRLPIQLALCRGKHVAARTGRAPISRLDLTQTPLEFRPVDERRYPLFRTILGAAAASPAARAAVTLAAEHAAYAFLTGNIGYLDQVAAVQNMMKKLAPTGRVTMGKIASFQKALL